MQMIYPQAKYRKDIDGLRGVAIIAVLAFHAFPQWFESGFIGVDIFFVISGYLITSIILNDIKMQNFSFGIFYIRRINRIFPALIITLLGVFISGWFFIVYDQFVILSKYIAGGAVFISNILLWHDSDYFDATKEFNPLLNLWSLGVEEQFYLTWPILLVFISKIKNKRYIKTLILLIISSSFLFHFALDETVEGFYSPFSRFWELMVGCYLAIFACRVNKAKANIASIVGFVLISIGLIFIDKHKAHLPCWLLFPVIGSSFLLASGQFSSVNKKILSNPILVFFGLISYPLYLYHWPLLSLINTYNAGKTILGNMAIITLSIFISWITYVYIEKPIRFGGYKKLKAIVLVLFMVFVAIISYCAYATNWAEVKLPTEFRTQTLYAESRNKWIQSVRRGICDIEEPSIKTRSAICYEATRPSILLWGDSHAASLYPGLKKIQQNSHFGIVQVTQSACPPIFNLVNLSFRKNCNEINEEIFNFAVKFRPDIIILHAAWKLSYYELTNNELEEKLTATLIKLKKELPGVRVIVIGPTPRWEVSPRQVAFLNWRKTGILPIPIRQKATTLDDIDQLLYEATVKTNFEFISIIKILCDGDNCLLKASEDQSEFMAFDSSHLTASGSELVIDKIKLKLLKE